MEACKVPNVLPDEFDCGSIPDLDKQTNCNSNEKTYQQPGHNKGSKADAICSFIRSFPTAPISLIFSTKHWRTSQYKYISKKSPLIQTIISIIQSEYSEMTMKELSELTFKNPNILYGQINDDTYYNLESSLYISEEILKFQFDDDINEIKFFLEKLYSLLDRKIPKHNSFLVWSKQLNAGKNVSVMTL